MLFPPETIADNPPESWQVLPTRDCDGSIYGYFIATKNGDRLSSSFTRKRDALAALESGFERKLYDKELRWYSGEPVHPYRPLRDMEHDLYGRCVAAGLVPLVEVEGPR